MVQIVDRNRFFPSMLKQPNGFDKEYFAVFRESQKFSKISKIAALHHLKHEVNLMVYCSSNSSLGYIEIHYHLFLRNTTLPNQECSRPVTVEAVVKIKHFGRASVNFVTNLETSTFLHLLENFLIPFVHTYQHYVPQYHWQ